MAAILSSCSTGLHAVSCEREVLLARPLKSSSLVSAGALSSAVPARKSRTVRLSASRVTASLSVNELSARVASGVTAVGLASFLQFSSLIASDVALASEYNILQSPPPLESHVIDDAGVLSRLTKSDLKRLLTDLEEKTGFHIDVVTLRKISSKGDVFELADQVIETWYPTIEDGNQKGVVLLVTTAKEGAIAGGPAFNEAVGDEILEAIVAENLPVLATAEKYNEALYSSAKRLAAKLSGQDDISGPRFDENKRISNYKTKEETEQKRGQFTFVVGGLLVIAFVVPMAQYYAYVSKK